MPYLVDGHNLIPHIPGIQLGDLDDELDLIQRLAAFAGQRGTTVEVYFDRGQPGTMPRKRYGRVLAYFVREGKTADQAIRERLHALGKAAKNWKVVSSDREVIREAGAHRAGVVRSGEFAGLLEAGKGGREADPRAGSNPELTPEDIQYWLDQFGES